MSYKTEFPDFVLDVDIPEGFEDTSYRNNSCPSWTKGDLTIFVDYADASLREFPEFNRFNVQRFNEAADSYEDVINTDDWQDVLAAIA